MRGSRCPGAPSFAIPRCERWHTLTFATVRGLRGGAPVHVGVAQRSLCCWGLPAFVLLLPAAMSCTHLLPTVLVFAADYFHYTMLAWLPTYFCDSLSLNLAAAAQVGGGKGGGVMVGRYGWGPGGWAAGAARVGTGWCVCDACPSWGGGIGCGTKPGGCVSWAQLLCCVSGDTSPLARIRHHACCTMPPMPSLEFTPMIVTTRPTRRCRCCLQWPPLLPLPWQAPQQTR